MNSDTSNFNSSNFNPSNLSVTAASSELANRGVPTRSVNRRLLALVVAVAGVAAACGSTGDDTATGATLPEAPVVPTSPAPDTPTSPAPDTPVETDAPPQPEPEPVAEGLESARADLDAARALWAANGPSSYTMVTQPLCFCIQEEWQHTIVDGVATENVAVTAEAFSDPGPLAMTDLFDMIEQAIAESPVSISATYDDTTGAVDDFFVDLDELIADEEYGMAVLSLTF